MKSIKEQVGAMEALWAHEFELVECSDNTAHWIGRLTPNNATYKVQIRYRAPWVIEIPRPFRFQPRVQVLDPLLQKHPKTGDAIPHVYRNDDDPPRPFLCLFDPEGGEWSPACLIAETTVPWTSLHLHYYEGWLLTGKWVGPERHPTANDPESTKKRSATIRRDTTGSSTAAILAGLQAFPHSQH